MDWMKDTAVEKWDITIACHDSICCNCARRVCYKKRMVISNNKQALEVEYNNQPC